jgi:hypothetical protein
MRSSQQCGLFVFVISILEKIYNIKSLYVKDSDLRKERTCMKDLIQTIICYAVIAALILLIISMNIWLIIMLFSSSFSFWEVLGCLAVLFIDWVIGICLRADNQK